jgi:hypothetical protein
MAGNAVGKRLHQLLAYLSILLMAASAVVLIAAPAQATVTHQGMFRICSDFSCLEVHGANMPDNGGIYIDIAIRP